MNADPTIVDGIMKKGKGGVLVGILSIVGGIVLSVLSHIYSEEASGAGYYFYGLVLFGITTLSVSFEKVKQAKRMQSMS